jgi:hypothetical protein
MTEQEQIEYLKATALINDEEGNFPAELTCKLQDVVSEFYRPIISSLQAEIERLNRLLNLKNENPNETKNNADSSCSGH